MKRISYIAFSILTLLGCNNSENKGDINECISLFRTAESCKQIDKELPCGLRFGMNMKEMKTHLEELASRDNEVKKKGNWKSRARLTPEGKAALTPENLLFLTPVKS